MVRCTEKKHTIWSLLCSSTVLVQAVAAKEDNYYQHQNLTRSNATSSYTRPSDLPRQRQRSRQNSFTSILTSVSGKEDSDPRKLKGIRI
ncbi:hypothetical protein Tco_1474009 [Tanacetum coccineum]